MNKRKENETEKRKKDRNAGKKGNNTEKYHVCES